MAFQPLQVAHAVGTEAPQGIVTDHTPGFVLEVIEHGFGAVVETRRLLMTRAATGVHHPAALGAGAAAGETVGDQYVGTLGASLQGGAGTGRAPADDQHVALFIPGHTVAIGHLQRRQHVGAGEVIGH
ncbi:hypothetical protein D3C76_620330 [compost metagenome]